MSLTKPSSPSSGTAQNGQMAWNASQPWGMGTCCQNLKQSKMLIGKQQEQNQHSEMWLDQIQAKLNSRQCWLAAFFTPDYQKRSNSFAGADEFFIASLLRPSSYVLVSARCLCVQCFCFLSCPPPQYFTLGSAGQQCNSAWVDATQIH